MHVRVGACWAPIWHAAPMSTKACLEVDGMFTPAAGMAPLCSALQARHPAARHKHHGWSARGHAGKRVQC